MAWYNKSMKLYKLTDHEGQTLGQTQWGENVEHTRSGAKMLCSPGWLHAYKSPALAVLMAPLFMYDGCGSQLWSAVGEVGADNGLIVGCYTLRTMKKIRKPRLTLSEHIRFGILCALNSTSSAVPEFKTWAESWLSSADRSCETASKLQQRGISGSAYHAVMSVVWSENDDRRSRSYAAHAAYAAHEEGVKNFKALAQSALDK